PPLDVGHAGIQCDDGDRCAGLERVVPDREALAVQPADAPVERIAVSAGCDRPRSRRRLALGDLVSPARRCEASGEKYGTAGCGSGHPCRQVPLSDQCGASLFSFCTPKLAPTVCRSALALTFGMNGMATPRLRRSFTVMVPPHAISMSTAVPRMWLLESAGGTV